MPFEVKVIQQNKMIYYGINRRHRCQRQNAVIDMGNSFRNSLILTTYLYFFATATS